MGAPDSFSELIRARRHAAGFTQAELGRLVGRSASAVAGWERGQSLPGERETLEALAAALGITDRELAEHLDPDRLGFDATGMLEGSGEEPGPGAELSTRLVAELESLWMPVEPAEPEVIEPEPIEVEDSRVPAEPERVEPEARTERTERPSPDPPPPLPLPPSYLEDPQQLDLYRVRAALTAIILLGLLAVAVWAVGELRHALRDVLELF